MPNRARLALLAGALLTPVGCGPLEEPWLISYPVTWGISTHVVENGPVSGGVSAPPGRTRVAMLPGDTVELRWFGAGPPGARLRPPIWLVAPYVYPTALEACPTPLRLGSGLCRLGEGDRIRVTLATDGSYYYAEVTQGVRVLAIASDGDRIDPETCLQRAFSERDADLGGCLIASHTVPVGPEGTLWRYFPDARPGSVNLEEVPDEYIDAPANLNPVFGEFRLEYGDVVEQSRDGDTVLVPPGEHVRVTARLAADVAQAAIELGPRGEDGRYTTEASRETITVASRLNYPVYDYEAADDERTVAWTAPDAGEEVTLYVQATDERGGFAFASLRFVSALVDPP